MIKFCKKCGCETEHYKSGHCAPCSIARMKAWVAANPDRKRSNDALWRKLNPEKAKTSRAARYEANKERSRALSAAHYLANKERIREYNAAWYQKNAERVKARQAANYAANPGKARTFSQNRRAKMMSRGGKLSHGLATRLYRLQKGRCACCGLRLGDDYHLDHIMPLALGGTNTDDNIQLLRSECNRKKHARHPVEFMQSRGFLL